jgi:uncharacterized protein (TIGR00251 family)
MVRMADAELTVRLQPRSRREEVVGERDGAVLVRVNAPPVEGRANAALCRLIAKRAGVPAGRVEVVRGMRSRDKVVRVSGMALDDLRRALGVD